MLRRMSLVLFVMVLGLTVAVPAFADQPDNVGGGLGNKAPDFSEGVFGDGQAWGTKGTTTLPEPNGKNDQSYDKLFDIIDGVQEQLPVSEAAPGNPMYNGGRWWLHTATWVAGTPVLLTSYKDVKDHYNQGHLVFADAKTYFQCPLLPVK